MGNPKGVKILPEEPKGKISNSANIEDVKNFTLDYTRLQKVEFLVNKRSDLYEIIDLCS